MGRSSSAICRPPPAPANGPVWSVSGMESWRKIKLDVLVVEDDLFFGVRIEKTLLRLGYEVRMAKSRDEALAMAETHPPALVIVNFGRDHLGPTEVVQRIKALPHAP